jgi:hypothetical protein
MAPVALGHHGQSSHITAHTDQSNVLEGVSGLHSAIKKDDINRPFRLGINLDDSLFD